MDATDVSSYKKDLIKNSSGSGANIFFGLQFFYNII